MQLKLIDKFHFHLHTEENLVLPLKLGKNGDEIGLEEARDVGRDESIETDEFGLETLELLGSD